jgi:hypothetical protein
MVWKQHPATDVLAVGEMPGPIPARGEVRIRIGTSGINAAKAGFHISLPRLVVRRLFSSPNQWFKDLPGKLIVAILSAPLLLSALWTYITCVHAVVSIGAIASVHSVSHIHHPNLGETIAANLFCHCGNSCVCVRMFPFCNGNSPAL